METIEDVSFDTKLMNFFRDKAFPIYEEGRFKTFSHTVPDIQRKLEILHSLYGELKLYEYGVPEHLYATVLVYSDLIYTYCLPQYIYFSNYGVKTWEIYGLRILKDLTDSSLFSKTDIDLIIASLTKLTIFSNQKNVTNNDIRITRINGIVNEINIYAFFADYGSPKQVYDALIHSYKVYHMTSIEDAIKRVNQELYVTYCAHLISPLRILAEIPFYYKYNEQFKKYIKEVATQE